MTFLPLGTFFEYQEIAFMFSHAGPICKYIVYKWGQNASLDMHIYIPKNRASCTTRWLAPLTNNKLDYNSSMLHAIIPCLHTCEL